MNKINSESMIAKKHLKNISSRDEIENIFKKVYLNSLEDMILRKHLILNKTIYSISYEMNISESTVKRHLKNSLNKVFKFLVDTKVIHF